MTNKLYDIIFTYLSNPDLQELTQHRNTRSIPYSGRYRVIDFMFSNMVNADISDVGLTAHANYQFLLDHVGSGKDWDLSRKHGDLRILPPFGYPGWREGVYRSRMDALADVRSYLQYIQQDYVVLAGGDLAVNLPLNDIFEAHIRNDADITAVCTSRPMGSPKDCNYFTIDAGRRITDVLMHPPIARGCESLKVYILSKQLLLSLVDHCAAYNILPLSIGALQAMVGQPKICPYAFDGYVARLQPVTGYFVRSMELPNPEVRTDLFVPGHPVRIKDRSDPSTYYGSGSEAVDPLATDGCITKGEAKNSILFRGVRVEKGAKVSGCVLIQGTAVQAGVVLRYATTGKNMWINPGRMLMSHNTYPLSIAKNEIV